MPTSRMLAAGREVLPCLAKIYPQLYLAPGPEGEAAYRPVVSQGRSVPGESLAHFRMDARDSCAYESTPAGEVLVVTLWQRVDFETFLHIMAQRCALKPIPATQGASILDGVINWTKIRAHEQAFYKAAAEAGEENPDWGAEFRRFTSDRRNYLDALIVLSSGPYSAVPGEVFGMDEESWRKASLDIRRYHECNHFLCRRLFPEKISAVWDELVADTVGVYGAFGRFDRAMIERFLGIEEGRYTAGRLENYVKGEGEARQAELDRLAKQCEDVLRHFEALIPTLGKIEPYALAIRLEDEFEMWQGTADS